MKTNIVLTLATTAIVAGLVIACNKTNSTSSNSGPNSDNTTTAQMQTQADDESQVNNELDNAETDVNNSLNASAAFSGTTGAGYENGIVTTGTTGGIILDLGICDATVTTDTANGLRQLIIT